MDTRSRVVFPLVVGALIIATIALAIWLRPETSSFQWPSDATRFDNNGISFSYPASWTVNDKLPATTGMGQTIALLGTQRWGACAAYDINCHYEQKLDPGAIEVRIERAVAVGGDGGFCSYARYRPDLQGRVSTDPQVVETRLFRVLGHPVIYTAYAVNGTDYYLSDEWRQWTIGVSDAGNEVFGIDSRFRGPGVDALHAALDAMVQTVQIGASPYNPPPQGNCTDLFPAD
jgi:hypothetical protein